MYQVCRVYRLFYILSFCMCVCVFAKHKKQERGGAGRGSWLIEVLVSLVSSFFFRKGRGWGEGGGRERLLGFRFRFSGFCRDVTMPARV